MSTREFSAFLTEQRNPRTMDLDRLPLAEMLRVINAEDATVAGIVAGALDDVARAVEVIVDRRLRGGRIFFVGAGTSGRLGVIEAAEQTQTMDEPEPPYFAIIAGGRDSVFRAKEGAEDIAEDGATAIVDSHVAKTDVVIGIAASGTTPFVEGALSEARRRGAGSILIACNPKGVPAEAADVVVMLPVGPEVVTGATRLRAATACKMVLNMTTVATLARTGRLYENLPVDVPKRSDKLIARAVRIVQTVTNASAPAALGALQQADYRAKIAIVMLKKDVPRDVAEKMLRDAGGFLRKVLEA